MKKNLHLLILSLTLIAINWQTANAQCGATASPDATIGCGSSYAMAAQTNAVVYSVVASACTPIAIAGTTAFPTACDDCVTGQIPLGFNFNFYGNVYNSAVISSNGLVGFGPFTFTGYTPFTIPAGGNPNNYIAGFMCDIDIRNGGTITYATIGTAPNRRFVVYYNNVATYGPGTGRATFQIVINENGSFQVIFSQLSANWNATTSGAFATSGAENIDGTLAFPVPGRNNTDWPGIAAGAQDCHIFNPQPCVFTEWRQGAAVVSTNPNYTVSPTTTTTYTAYWNCGGTTCSDPVVVTVATPTLTLGTPTNNTACGGAPNGSIPLTFTNVPNGTYTLSYSLNGTPTSASITVAANLATLSGLGAGTYTAFSIPSLGGGCANATAAGPVTITTPNLPTGTGVTICQGGSGALTSAFTCPATGMSIAQGAVFNSGALTASDPTWVRNGGGTTCNGAAGTTYYYDVFSFTVSTAGSYTFVGCFPAIDAHASLYQNAFNGANPCGTPANFIIANDDGSATCSLDPSLTATLSPGITYYIVSTSFGSLATDSYSWTFTGPAGATIITGGGPAGTLEWYTAAAGGTAIGTGSPFNPVGVAGSGLANTNTAGTTTYYLACSNTPTCRTAINFVINANPTPSISGTTTICEGSNTTLTASGGATYAWSGGLGAGASKNVAPTSTTAYTVTATNASGCTATANSTVTVNTVSTAPTIAAIAPMYCPNTSVTLNAAGGTAGTGSNIYWYTGANGTGTFLGTGASVNLTATTSETIYARRQGTCNNTTDDSEPLNVRTYIYATTGTTSTTYCTDNSGWHHFYNGSEIILSLQGDLSGIPAGFPQITIWDNGTWYQETQGPFTPASCAGGLTPGEERFEMERSWNVNMGGGVLNPPYNVRFYYQPAERTAIETAAANWMSTYTSCSYSYKYATPLGFYWFKNTSGDYTAPDYDSPLHPASSTGSTSNGVNYTELTGLASFSGGSGAIILVPDPLLNNKWLYFTGETDNKTNYLRWATETEQNTARFNIQRSQDGINFITIGAVAAQGNSTTTHHYTFDDINPFKGENYYRLELVKNDGDVDYSNTVRLLITDNGLGYNFYPNPTNDIVYYQYETNEKEDLRVEVLDVLGKQVVNFNITSNIGINNIPVDLSNFAAGSYMVRVHHPDNSNVHISKVIKNKF